VPKPIPEQDVPLSAAVRAPSWGGFRQALADWLSGNHRLVTRAGMSAAALIGALLAGAALAGDSWAAGFAAIADISAKLDWDWLPFAVACVVISHAGYTFAYREVLRSQGGPTVPMGRMGAAVLAGFGMLIPRAGFTLDRGFWRDHGLSVAAARDRVQTLGMLEWALLAPATFIAAVVLFAQHFPAQGGVLESWLIGVPAGTICVLALFVGRRWIPATGRAGAGVRRALEAVSAMLRMVLSSREGLLAVGGMSVYWAADIAALGACLAIVHHAVTPDVLIVGYATGYAFTRRSLPLAGAGAAEALMPFAMHWMTVPFAACVFAVFAYRLCNLWLPLAPAALCLRHLRDTSSSWSVGLQLP
jgi:uncharacterized membrane protein YbhN (UPF0104 family)